MRDMLCIMDFDSTSSLSIAKILRSHQLYCEIVSPDISLDDLLTRQPLGLVLAGGARPLPKGHSMPESFDRQVITSGLPMLALGDTAPMLASLFGGDIAQDPFPKGIASLMFEPEFPLFHDITDGERFIDTAYPLQLEASLHPILRGYENQVLGYTHESRPITGLQLYIERNDPDSSQLLLNFATRICGCNPWWTESAMLHTILEGIRNAAGDGRVMCAISGGIDSSVCAMLGHQALGDRMTCVFVDTGLLRMGEAEQVVSLFRERLGLNVVSIDAKKRFLDALAGITKNWDKQQAVADLLHNILLEEMDGTPEATLLLEGTNYSDILKTPTPHTMPAESPLMHYPLKQLFKEEVRSIGAVLGLPESLLRSQSFPGAGLALRIMGDVTDTKLSILRKADELFRQELEESLQQRKPGQYFAMLADIDTIRKGGITICLRAYQPSDAGDSMASRLPYDLLERVVEKILEEIPAAGRVVYDLTPHKE